MPNSRSLTAVRGEITDVFVHRFVVETAQGRILADIGPGGAKQLQPMVGDTVDLVGAQKPSELKVTRYTSSGRTVEIGAAPKDGDARVDPKVILAALRAAGFEPAGEMRRKPKHFEVPAKQDGKLVEVHVGLDGQIRKLKPAYESHVNAPQTA